jgi:hypothetical protein
MSVLLLAGCGCAGMSNTEAGMGTGALLGGAAGAVLARNPVAGLLVGGLAGAAVGGVAGSAADHAEAVHRHEEIVAAQARRMLTLNDVVALSQQGVNDAIIIQQIRETGSVYSLTANDILWLKSQRVSDAVVQEMQMRRPGYVYPPPYGPPPPYYVVEPAPPPVAIGLGFGYGRRW